MRKIQKRKADHIEVAMQEKVWPDHNHWDDVRLIQNSLPEVDLDDIDTSVRFLGKELDMPLVVTAITGGYAKAERINANLAEACADLRVGLGVGSQRAGIEDRSDPSYTVLRDHDVPLRIGNIGAPQLIKQGRKKAFTLDDVKAAFDMIDADVMAIHLNYLQEVAQPEGDLRAVGCLDRIRALAKDMPCMVKETGAGISEDVALRLKGTGVVALDVSGLSGTSFAAVEMHRAKRQGDEGLAAIGELYSDWGIPAPVSVVQCPSGAARDGERRSAPRPGPGEGHRAWRVLRRLCPGGAASGLGIGGEGQGGAGPDQEGAEGGHVPHRVGEHRLPGQQGLHHHRSHQGMDGPTGDVSTWSFPRGWPTWPKRSTSNSCTTWTMASTPSCARP